MEIVEIPKGNIVDIEPLWVELNAFHLARSSNFKAHFASFTFAERSKKLFAMENLLILGAKVNTQLVGYCIASSNDRTGEIDSLYVKGAFRGSSIGRQLIERAMAWLSGQNCTQISIYVVEGNETVLPFYEKFGFKERFRVLQIKNP